MSKVVLKTTCTGLESQLCIPLPNSIVRDLVESVGHNGSIYTTEIGKLKNQVVFLPWEEPVVKHLPGYQMQWNFR